MRKIKVNTVLYMVLSLLFVGQGQALAQVEVKKVQPIGYVALFPYNEIDIATKGVPVSEMEQGKANDLLKHVKEKSDNYRFLLWRDFRPYFRNVSLRVVKMEWGKKIRYVNHITAAGLYDVKERAVEMCKKMLSLRVSCMVSHVPDAMGAGKIIWDE